MRALTMLLLVLMHAPLVRSNEDPKEVVSTQTKIFMHALQSNDLKSASNLLATNEINWFGKVWFKTAISTGILAKYVGNELAKYDLTQSYSFDDCVSDKRAWTFVQPAYRIFDDRSILSVSTCSKWSAKTQTDSAVCLVFQRIDDTWRIVSISSAPWFNLVLGDQDATNPSGFDKCTLKEHHVIIAIPPSFEKQSTSSNQVDFVRLRDGVREAVYNVNSRILDFDAAPKDLPDPLLAFAEDLFKNVIGSMGSITSKSRKFFPCGYRFECTMTDQLGRNNRSISLILRVPTTNTVVWIQFFAFEEVYKSIWKDVDLSLRSIQIVQ